MANEEVSFREPRAEGSADDRLDLIARSQTGGSIPMSSAIKSGAMGALMGFIMSALVNFYLVPMPSTLAHNAIGNGMSGLVSGFMGGFMGVLIDSRQRSSRSR